MDTATNPPEAALAPDAFLYWLVIVGSFFDDRGLWGEPVENLEVSVSKTVRAQVSSPPYTRQFYPPLYFRNTTEIFGEERLGPELPIDRAAEAERHSPVLYATNGAWISTSRLAPSRLPPTDSAGTPEYQLSEQRCGGNRDSHSRNERLFLLHTGLRTPPVSSAAPSQP